MNDRMIEIATKTLAKASILDPTITVDEATILAWAEIFDFDGNVWLEEALASVTAHYAKPRSFRLMPGDVVEYCATQFPWSSREHAIDWLFNDMLDQHPFTPGLERYCGLTPPELRDMPSGLPDWEAHKVWAQERIGPWLRDNLDEIVDGMLRIRYTGQGGAA